MIILCVGTIIGSIFGILRAWLYEAVAHAADNAEYIRGWIYAIANIGTLTGAVMMLQRKLLGLHIYTVSQVVYIGSVIYTTFIYSDEFDGAGELAFVISLLFLLPSILFLVLYWLDVNRRVLS